MATKEINLTVSQETYEMIIESVRTCLELYDDDIFECSEYDDIDMYATALKDYVKLAKDLNIGNLIPDFNSYEVIIKNWNNVRESLLEKLDSGEKFEFDLIKLRNKILKDNTQI